MVNESWAEEYKRVCWNCIVQLVHSIFVPIITLSILNLWVINWYIYSADSWVLSRRCCHFQWSLCHDLVSWMEKTSISTYSNYAIDVCHHYKVEDNSLQSAFVTTLSATVRCFFLYVLWSSWIINIVKHIWYKLDLSVYILAIYINIFTKAGK